MKILFDNKRARNSRKTLEASTKNYIIKRKDFSVVKESSKEYSSTSQKTKPSQIKGKSLVIETSKTIKPKKRLSIGEKTEYEEKNTDSFATDAKITFNKKTTLITTENNEIQVSQKENKNTQSSTVHALSDKNSVSSETQDKAEKEVPKKIISFLSNDLTLSFKKPNEVPRCLMCGRVYPNSDVLTTSTCTHKFCVYCLGHYFRYKSQIGEFDPTELKCPTISCTGTYSYEDLHSYLPDDSISSGNKILSSHLQQLKVLQNGIVSYNEKNIIDINSNEHFYLFSKVKEGICPRCNKDYLFCRKGVSFLVCLGCLGKFCKYCRKEFNDRHLDDAYIGRCKIYFKIDETARKKRKKKCEILIIYIQMVLLISISFILCLCGVFCYLDAGIKKITFYNYFKKMCVIKCFVFILYLILITISFAVCGSCFLVLFPYFPILISLIF